MSCRKIGKLVCEVWIMTSDMHCCAAAVEADFLGFGSSPAAADEGFLPESPPAEPSGFNMGSQPAAYPAPPPTPPPAATPDGLADFFSGSAEQPTPSSSAADRSSTAHIDDMFSAGPRPAAPKPARAQQHSQATSGAASVSRGGQDGAAASSSSKPAAPKPAAPSSMIDFGDEAAMLAQNPELYQGLEAVEGMTVCSSKPDTAYGLYTALPSVDVTAAQRTNVVGGLQLPIMGLRLHKSL